MNIKQQDPATGAKINKNVSSKDYYAYRLMIRCDQNNVILRCRELGRHVCKDRERTIMIYAIQSKKVACRSFSTQLLDIGDRKVTTDETKCIQLSTDFCTIIDSQFALIDQIFPNIHRQYTNQEWLAERAILVAKNVDVNKLNLKIQHLLPGDLVSYKSIDTVCDAIEAVNYPIVFKLIGFTSHATA
jgi:hypothetical protein